MSPIFAYIHIKQTYVVYSVLSWCLIFQFFGNLVMLWSVLDYNASVKIHRGSYTSGHLMKNENDHECKILFII